MRQSDHTGPIIYRATTIRNLVIVSRNDDLLGRLTLLSQHKVLHVFVLINCDLRRRSSRAFKKGLDGFQPFLVFTGGCVEILFYLFRAGKFKPGVLSTFRSCSYESEDG